MTKVDILKIEKRNSLIAFEEVVQILREQPNIKIRRAVFRENTIQIFFEESISFAVVEELLFEKIRVKEFRWRFEKAINMGTGYLDLVIP